jgi:RNA polymerase sigma-70 factor (ECF subfamily)
VTTVTRETLAWTAPVAVLDDRAHHGGHAAVDDTTPAPPGAAHADRFGVLVLPEIPVLLRVARSLTRHDADAEDLVQDTLLRAHRAIDSFDGRHPRAWLLTIMRNAHLNRQRRRHPEPVGDFADRADTWRAPSADGFVDAAFDAALERALGELPEPFRRVVDLVDVGGQSYAAAAAALGVPVGTVMSRLHRARARLRAHLVRAGAVPEVRP